MYDLIKNLFKVKSLVTLGLTGLFVWLGIKGVLPTEAIVGTYGLVLGSLLRNKTNKDTEDDINEESLTK